MYHIWYKEFIIDLKYIFITPWFPVKWFYWYKESILSVHTSDMANTVASLSGFDTTLNNNESNNIYFSTSTLIFFIAALLLDN